MVEETKKREMKTRIIVTSIILCVLNFIGGFVGYLFTSFDILTEPAVVITAFVVNLVVFVFVLWPVLKERATNLLNLLWLVIPSGLIALLAFLGFKTFEALERAHPSF